MVQAGKWLLVTIVAIATVLLTHSQADTSEQNFVGVSGNICPGDDLSFECTVYGGTATVWQGNAVTDNCEDQSTQNEIILLHNSFTQPKICNNGTIVVQGINAENNSYTSQLNITVTSDMVGKFIECIHDSNSESDTLVGSYTISFLTPGPEYVHISAVDTGLKQISFSWSPVNPDCTAIHYNILASNCGSCPTTTNHTTVTCTDVSNDHNIILCNFVVQTVVDKLIGGNTTFEVEIKNVLMHESPYVLIRTEGVFLAGIISMVIALLLIAMLCCVCVGLKITKSRAKPTLRDVSNAILTHQDQAAQNDVPNCVDDDTKSYEYSELEEIPLNLNSLLQKLQGCISKQWYQFGLLLGIPMDVLEGFNLYLEKDCLVEVLDYWLKNHPGKPTWQQITDAQRKIKIFNNHQSSAEKKESSNCDEIPPPKPPRQSSSVTEKKSGTTIPNENNTIHEYEYIN